MQAVAFVFIAASFVVSGNAGSVHTSPAARSADVGGPMSRSAAAGALRSAVRLAGESLPQRPAPAQQATKTHGASWVVRHPVIAGTLIGTGAGLALSRTDTIGGRNHDPRVALVGTGAGAWGGLIVSAVQKARAKQKVGIGTKAGIAAGAVAAVILPVLACYGAGGCGGSS